MATHLDVSVIQSHNKAFALEGTHIKEAKLALASGKIITKKKDNSGLTISPNVYEFGFQSAKSDPEVVIGALNAAKIGAFNKNPNDRDFKTMLIGISKFDVEKFESYYNTFKT